MAGAQSDLILTKLSPPVAGQGTVARPRLIEPVRRDGLRRLTLVAAPAGFGKTTLLAAWFHTIAEATPITPCWLALDAADGDSRQFLSYVIGALKTADATLGDAALELLESQAKIDPTQIIGRLVNDLVAGDHALALFLDDYHSVDGAAAGEVVTTLLALAPANFHLVIASRQYPALPVASFRVRADLCELGAGDLRFDDQEADRFVKKARGLVLDRRQMTILQERTEGWAAGLQLATLFHGDNAKWDEFITSFSGSVREVADYLAADVLNRQRPELREFLLQTSVLDRMSAGLAEAVSGRRDSQRLLEDIEALNLFVVPLDRERKWYRYHHLFRDFLRSQLDRATPELVPDLNRRASRWCAAANLPTEAIGYALKAEDFDSVAALVEEHALAMLRLGAMPRLEEWIGRLPPSVVARRPRIPLFQCWALFHMQRPHEARAALERAEIMIADRRARGETIDGVSPAELSAEINALRAGIAIAYDDVDAVKILAVELPERQPGPMTWIAAVISNIRGYACLARSEFSEARACLARARAAHGEFGSAFGIVYADCFLGMVELAEGHLHAAAALFQQAADIAVRGHCHAAGPAVANVLRGRVLYEWNRLADAEALIAADIGIIDQCGHVEIQITSYVTLALIAEADGRRAEANAHFDRVFAICGSGHFRRQRIHAVHEKIRSLLTHGEAAAARDLALAEEIALAGPPACDGMGWNRIACLHDLIRARFALAAGDGRHALAFIAPSLAAAQSVGRRQRAIELQLLKAAALRLQGDDDAALATLEEALQAAETERFMRLFLDQGELTRELFHTFAGRIKPAPHYTRQIAAALAGPARPLEALSPGAPVPLELLSARESDVLTLLAAGKSNRLIAAELAIAENTVKWHVKNIFQKFGVENRTTAVLAAQQMNLLS